MDTNMLEQLKKEGHVENLIKIELSKKKRLTKLLMLVYMHLMGWGIKTELLLQLKIKK